MVSKVSLKLMPGSLELFVYFQGAGPFVLAGVQELSGLLCGSLVTFVSQGSSALWDSDLCC